MYPKTLFDTISSFIKKNGCSGYDVAVDVACGSGQSTFPLYNLFQKVIGVDISEAQITNARAKIATTLQGSKNIKFMVGDAHNLCLDSSSADLITCATAWHWLDSELFYREAKRILKPKGCLAVYGYTEGMQWWEIITARHLCQASLIASERKAFGMRGTAIVMTSMQPQNSHLLTHNDMSFSCPGKLILPI